MSHSLPERWLPRLLRPTLRIALLAQCDAQLARFGRVQQQWQCIPLQPSARHGLADALTFTLSQAPATLPPAGRVRLLLPDSVAQYRLLPWTASFTDQQELNQFALESFALAGLPVRDGWAVQAAWQGADAPALAYALPHALLDSLQGRLDQYGLQLERAVPLSAARHYGQLSFRRHHHACLLNSGSALSWLAYRHGKLAQHLVEARHADLAATLRRLLARCDSALSPLADYHTLTVV
ncbi:hypothetical protein, partial [Chitinimonas sp.]|uniref:hypothetical protein n=1 Tax=Chitinimonas sp. TaxID=1934313 RepID=UPI0035AF47D3